MINLATLPSIFNFGDLLNELNNMGFFSLILPFLLVFAISFAILTQIPLFKDGKGPASIIAVSIGLISLQFGAVPEFFTRLFPNLGIGLGILLAGLILAGVFLSSGTAKDLDAYKWIFFGLGALIFIIVVLVSLSDWGYGNTGFDKWKEYRGIIVVIIVIATAGYAIIAANKGA